MKVFRINPEFRILRLTNTINHLKHEIIRFCRHHASLKNRISKVQDFGIFELSPMGMFIGPN